MNASAQHPVLVIGWANASRTNALGAFDICMIATKPDLFRQQLLELACEEVAIILAGIRLITAR